VNDLLKTAARQTATFLGQMQATEALLEARKFDAFNRMSAPTDERQDAPAADRGG
jgi:hypothetical protein